jgi:hypothetical protein
MKEVNYKYYIRVAVKIFSVNIPTPLQTKFYADVHTADE